jgi:SAM-dependent methyltransferase
MASTPTTADEASIEGVIKDEVLRMYEDVATSPDQEFHFFHGRTAATMFGYEADWLERAPEGAVESFAGVGNPHARAELKAGQTVLDLGSGAGLDSIIAAWRVGSSGWVVGIDMNDTMLEKARRNAASVDLDNVELRKGQMENIPADDDSIDTVISNGVINLSFRKRRVIEELYRVLAPGGRVSITDIVSAKQLSQSIVNDPKLWAA